MIASILVILLTLSIQILEPCGLATDNFCDDEYNNAECNWDGGACCDNHNDGWDKFCTECECKGK